MTYEWHTCQKQCSVFRLRYTQNEIKMHFSDGENPLSYKKWCKQYKLVDLQIRGLSVESALLLTDIQDYLQCNSEYHYSLSHCRNMSN